jgi:Polyketide cyclase / dehydrase and lipid transport
MLAPATRGSTHPVRRWRAPQLAETGVELARRTQPWLAVSIVVLLACLCASAGGGALAQSDAALPWAYYTTRDGIALYTSDVPDHPYPAVKGSLVLPTGAEPIYLALYDFGHYPRWYHHCAEVRILSAPATQPSIPLLTDGRFGPIPAGGPWELFFRQRTPPLDDRWAVLRCTYRQGPRHSLLVEFASVEPHPFKPPPGLTRMHLHGYWLVEPIDREHTRVTFELAVDPHTGAPGWLVNPVLRDTVRETLLNLGHVVGPSQDAG